MDDKDKTNAVVFSVKKRLSMSKKRSGSGGQHATKRSRKSILILAIVLVAAGGLLTIKLWPKSKSPPPKTIQKTFENSSKLMQRGQYNMAQKELQDYIQSSASDSDKRDAKMSLARVLVYKKEYDAALNLLLDLDKSGQDLGYTTYTTMVGLYEKKNDTQSAKKYVQKAIDSIKKSPEPTDDLYLPQYEEKLKDLGT